MGFSGGVKNPFHSTYDEASEAAGKNDQLQHIFLRAPNVPHPVMTKYKKKINKAFILLSITFLLKICKVTE